MEGSQSVSARCLNAPLRSTGSEAPTSQGWRRVSVITGLGRRILSREMNQPPRRGNFESGEDLSAKYEPT